MNFDLNELKEKVARYSDDELIAMTTINHADYQEEMIELARAELEKRGIAADEQTIIFDVDVNSDNYAGRLILIGEELLFLSTGMSGNKSFGRGGLAGLLIQETRAAERSVKSQALDFSAIDNEGSWAYFLDEIAQCTTNSSWFSGKSLTVEGKDQNGNQTTHTISNDKLSEMDFIKLKLKIEEEKFKLERKNQ